MKNYIYAIFLSVLMISCGGDGGGTMPDIPTPTPTPTPTPAETVDMRSVTISLQLSDAQPRMDQANSKGSRSVDGDPGLGEDAPNAPNIYGIVYAEYGGHKYIQEFTTTVAWTYTPSTTDAQGRPTNNKLYTATLEFSYPQKLTAGRVLLFACNDGISVNGITDQDTFFFNEAGNYPTPITIEQLNTLQNDAVNIETKAAGVKFDVTATGLEYSKALRNVFSIPYSFGADGMLTKDGDPNIVLYHAAAKLDIDWEVHSSRYSDTWVSAFTVNNLKTTGISCFKPAEVNPESGSLSVPFTINAGNKYIGRQYIYVAQDGNAGHNFPLNFTLTNGAKSTSKPGSESLPLGASYFTTWMRYQLKLNYP